MERKYIDVPFEKEDIQENGIFSGYGSTFGGKPDSYGDIIAEGAFTDTIKNNGRGGVGIALLYQHDSKSPVGVWEEILENKKGLKVRGKLALENTQAKDAYALLKVGALKGLSIGFDLPRDKHGKIDPESYEIDEKARTRTLKKINLWEISLVTFAANTRASVSNVKDAKTIRQLENYFHHVAGFSISESLYLAKLCRNGLRELVDDDIDINESEESMNSLLSTLTETNASLRNIIKEVSIADQFINEIRQVNEMLKG